MKYLRASKIQNHFWDEYEPNEHEPSDPSHYDLSSELEEELLDNRPFLKQRVWRNMHKVQRHNARVVHSSHFPEFKTFKIHLNHHHRLVRL